MHSHKQNSSTLRLYYDDLTNKQNTEFYHLDFSFVNVTIMLNLIYEFLKNKKCETRWNSVSHFSLLTCINFLGAVNGTDLNSSPTNYSNLVTLLFSNNPTT